MVADLQQWLESSTNDVVWVETKVKDWLAVDGSFVVAAQSASCVVIG